MSTISSASSNGSLSDCEDNRLVERAREIESDASKSEHFRMIQNIDKIYKLGEDVIPQEEGSQSSSKAVVFARRRADNKLFIIKWRSKAKSFKDEQEVADWTLITKIMYKMSGGNAQIDGKNFSKEVNFASKIPRTASCADILEDSTKYYQVMECVQGRDLFDFFIQEKVYDQPYRNELVRDLTRELLKSVQEFHAAGLVHKDLKLENIVMDERKGRQTGAKLHCKPKIIDYDTAQAYSPNNKIQYVMGTDQYIAPESYAGMPQPASDMWAIGVIVYCLLTGALPFHYALFDDKSGENIVGHPKMDQIRRRLRIARIDWTARCWGGKSGVLARDFTKKLFHCDPKRRLTADGALDHPWFKTTGSGDDGEAVPNKRKSSIIGGSK